MPSFRSYRKWGNVILLTLPHNDIALAGFLLDYLFLAINNDNTLLGYSIEFLSLHVVDSIYLCIVATANDIVY